MARRENRRIRAAAPERQQPVRRLEADFHPHPEHVRVRRNPPRRAPPGTYDDEPPPVDSFDAFGKRR